MKYEEIPGIYYDTIIMYLSITSTSHCNFCLCRTEVFSKPGRFRMQPQHRWEAIFFVSWIWLQRLKVSILEHKVHSGGQLDILADGLG